MGCTEQIQHQFQGIEILYYPLRLIIISVVVSILFGPAVIPTLVTTPFPSVFNFVVAENFPDVPIECIKIVLSQETISLFATSKAAPVIKASVVGELSP